MKKIFLTLFASLSLLSGANAQTKESAMPDLKQLYDLTDSLDVNLRASHSPLIGLSASINDNGYSMVSATYINSIVKAGGTPVILPAVTDGQTLRNAVAQLDGLVLVGGADVNPLWYGESPIQQLGGVDPQRDLYELKLIKLASDRNIPILGICRGCQLLNVAFGGTLYQDIPALKTLNHQHYILHQNDVLQILKFSEQFAVHPQN